MNKRRELLKLGVNAAWIAPVVQIVSLPAHAQATPLPTVVTLGASIDQAQEVPPTGDPTTGSASMTYNRDTGDFTLNVTFTGLVNFTTAHIHVGAVGVSGSVISLISSGFTPPGSINFTGVIPAANRGDVIAGNTYVNLHNSAHPAGAARGQLTL